jgi:hypothetical protein
MPLPSPQSDPVQDEHKVQLKQQVNCCWIIISLRPSSLHCHAQLATACHHVVPRSPVSCAATLSSQLPARTVHCGGCRLLHPHDMYAPHLLHLALLHQQQCPEHLQGST